MLVKILLFIVLLLISAIYEKTSNNEKKISKLFYILIILILTIPFAFREFIFEDFGTDYISYMQWYEYVSFSSINWNSISNLGFNVLISLSKIIFNNYYLFLFVCGLIINCCVFKFIKKNSKNICLSLMIYFTFFYFNTFNILRQWIACSIFLLAYQYIGEKKFFKYALMCMIASLFHSSAILLIAVYPVLSIKKMSLKRISIYILAGIIIILNVGFIEKNIIYSSDIYLFNDYSKYINYNEGLSNYVNCSICLINFIALLWVAKISKYSLKDKNNSIQLLYLILALIFSFISVSSFAFSRFSMYFLPAIMLTIPDVINLFRKQDKFVISIIIYCLLLYIVIT